MIVEQTVEIPASRRLFFDLPLEFPIGKAKVEVKSVNEPNREQTDSEDPVTARLNAVYQSQSSRMADDLLRAQDEAIGQEDW
jgi:hypothetical protein